MESKRSHYMAKNWSFKMPEGLGLEVSHHPLTMKCVANLIIAMERIKAGIPEPVLSTDFQDENLLSIMLESIVEEQTVIERTAAPAQFSRTGEQQCSITDGQKRSLVLVRSSMELHAVMLQGGSDNRKVYLNMSTYVHPAPIAEARPVALGIKDTNLYLSCHKDGDKPTLHLEEVTDKTSLLKVRDDSEMVRFLFYKRDSGLNISTLMSARYPNWYISTAQDDNQVVEMCEESAPRSRIFDIQRQS